MGFRVRVEVGQTNEIIITVFESPTEEVWYEHKNKFLINVTDERADSEAYRVFRSRHLRFGWNSLYIRAAITENMLVETRTLVDSTYRNTRAAKLYAGKLRNALIGAGAEIVPPKSAEKMFFD